MGSLSQEASSSRASSARAGPEVSRRTSLLDGPLLAADRIDGSLLGTDPDAPLAVSPNVRAANARATPALLRNGPTPAYLDLVRDALRRDPTAAQPELEDQARQIEARDPERGEEFRRAVANLEGDLGLAPIVGRVRPVSLGISGESVAGGDTSLRRLAPNRLNLLGADRGGEEGGAPGQGETQMALAGPALRLAPLAFRFLRGLIVGKAAEEALKQHSEEDPPSESNAFEALPAASGSSGPPPFEPDGPDPDDDRREGREAAPQDPPKVPGFKLEDRGTHIEIFPDDSEEFAKLLVDESKGNQETQEFNRDTKDAWLEARNRSNWPELVHKNGAEKTERVLQHKPRDGVDDPRFDPDGTPRSPNRGSARPDVSLYDKTRNVWIHINTVDVRADRTTLTTREAAAAARIENNKEDIDIFVVSPKPGKGRRIDKDALVEYATPLLRELKELIDSGAITKDSFPNQLFVDPTQPKSEEG